MTSTQESDTFHLVTSVRIADYFEARLLEIERHWLESGNAPAFEHLIERLERQVIPVLKRFPKSARCFPGDEREIYESIPPSDPMNELLARAKEAGGETFVHAFGEAPCGEYVLLYLLAGEMLVLLSIRRRKRGDEGVPLTSKSSSAPHSGQSDRSRD